MWGKGGGKLDWVVARVVRIYSPMTGFPSGRIVLAMIQRSTDGWRSITLEEWRRPDGVKVVKDGDGWAVQTVDGTFITGHYGNRLQFETDEQACEACDLGKVEGVGATREE